MSTINTLLWYIGYCFSASLPPVVVSAAMEGLKYIDERPELMAQLRDLSCLMYNQLKDSTILGQIFHITGDPHSPVVLLGLKSNIKHSVINDVIEVVRELCDLFLVI